MTMRKTIRRCIDKMQNNLTFNLGEMTSDLLAVYRLFGSVDRDENFNLDHLPSCGRMYRNWMNKYRAVTNADLDSKAALCSMFVRMISELRHGPLYIDMIHIDTLER